MRKVIKLLFKHSLLIAIFITIAILVLSLIPISAPPINVSNLDKYEHSIAYFVLTISWLIVIKINKLISKKILVVCICVFFGIIIEFAQSNLTTYRSFDTMDMIANSIGVFLALLFFNFFEKKIFQSN